MNYVRCTTCRGHHFGVHGAAADDQRAELVGWRLFYLHRGRLCSPMQGELAPVDRDTDAVCLHEDHTPPAVGCWCGWRLADNIPALVPAAVSMAVPVGFLPVREKLRSEHPETGETHWGWPWDVLLSWDWPRPPSCGSEGTADPPSQRMTTTHVRASARRQNAERPPGADTQPKEQMMSSTKSPPESLEERAERAAAELAEVRAEQDRIAQAEQDRIAAHWERFDQALVDDYGALRDQSEVEVETTRAALREAVLADPVTVAMAEFATAQALRRQRFTDYLGARGRQGHNIANAQLPQVEGTNLEELRARLADQQATAARQDAEADVAARRADPDHQGGNR